MFKIAALTLLFPLLLSACGGNLVDDLPAPQLAALQGDSTPDVTAVAAAAALRPSPDGLADDYRAAQTVRAAAPADEAPAAP